MLRKKSPGDLRTALVSAPFFSIKHPSIQLGVLRSVLVQNRNDVSDFYLNFSFAQAIGVDFYESAAKCCHFLLGDWLFSHAAFGRHHYSDEYLASISSLLIDHFQQCDSNEVISKLNTIRDVTIPLWLDSVVSGTEWKKFQIIGFSCTFTQVVSSIAIAKRIKEVHPKVIILLGGSSVEGPMGVEISKRVPWVDCVVQGEGEHALPAILSMVEDRRAVPRVFSSRQKTVLNRNPIPNYDTYYASLRATPDLQALEQRDFGVLSIEASRGCWWAEKQKCIFCGLNGNNVGYREKSSRRILEEMDVLGKKYRRYDFQMIDNVISERAYRTLLPALARNRTSYRIFFETRSNLTRSRLRALKNAGALFLQPGIESLSTSVLKLMRKGVTATHNIETLKWGRFHGVEILWNILYGIPEETVQAYKDLVDLIPKIHHFQPPVTIGHVRMDRFSPLFEEYRNGKRRNQFVWVRPSPFYKYSYPDDWDFSKLAYYFVFKAKSNVPMALYRKLERVTKHWQELWTRADLRPALEFRKGLTYGHVVDSRTPGNANYLELDGQYFEVAKALDKKSMVLTELAAAVGLTPNETEKICDDFVSESIVVNPDGRYIWLPVPEKM